MKQWIYDSFSHFRSFHTFPTPIHSPQQSKMRGWFDLFRENGGPTLYTASNRTPVAGDATTITLCIVFGTLYLAFFVIFPGVRKERFTTFLSVTLSLFVGTAILREYNSTMIAFMGNILLDQIMYFYSWQQRLVVARGQGGDL